jgi:transposase InsO family protein
MIDLARLLDNPTEELRSGGMRAMSERLGLLLLPPKARRRQRLAIVSKKLLNGPRRVDSRDEAVHKRGPNNFVAAISQAAACKDKLNYEDLAVFWT